MYSNSILWIGLSGDYYSGFIFDFTSGELKEISSQLKNFNIRKITPIGQKYFMLCPLNNLLNIENDKTYIYKCENLMFLNKFPEPVHQINRDSFLYPIDWSSSSIKHLGSIAFVQTFFKSHQIDFLDKNFQLIITLEIGDLFPNYQWVTKARLWEDEIISVNANCLLYYEHIVQDNNNNDTDTGQKNIYCWDFTTNSQVFFPSYICKDRVLDIVPFRDSNDQVKYLTYNDVSFIIYAKIYKAE